MRTRSWIAIASLAICNVAGAQDSLPSRTLTRMIVGLGFPNGGVDRFTPTYTLGFELGPFNRRTSLRLMSEYVENTTARQSYYSHERARWRLADLRHTSSLARACIHRGLINSASCPHSTAPPRLTTSRIAMTSFQPSSGVSE